MHVLLCSHRFHLPYHTVPSFLSLSFFLVMVVVQLVLSVIQLPIPLVEQEAVDVEDRPKWHWWKLKKWALNTGLRFIMRYGDTKVQQNQSDQVGSKIFSERCLVPFLEAYMTHAASLSTGTYMTPRAKNATIQFLLNAMSKGDAYKIMKPHMDALILQVNNTLFFFFFLTHEHKPFPLVKVVPLLFTRMVINDGAMMYYLVYIF